MMLKTRQVEAAISTIDVSMSSPRQPQTARNKTSPTKDQLFSYELGLH